MKLSECIVGLSLAVALGFSGYGALAAGSADAASIACAGNLKNLVQAMAGYAADHGGELPAAVDRTRKPWKWWYSEIFPYVSSPRDFYCPVKAPEFFDEGQASPLLPVVWDFHYLSYGYNSTIDIAQRTGKAVLMTEPARGPRIILAESNEYLAGPQASSWNRQITPRHDGRAHFAFTDGCVVLESPESAPRRNGEGIHSLENWSFP